MNAAPLSPVQDYYLVNHGKNGALGSFRVSAPLALRRGEKVVLETSLGLEVGAVLGPASVLQSRRLGDAGMILRRVQHSDEFELLQGKARADALFDQARILCRRLNLDLELLDVDLSLDGRQALLLVLAGDNVNADPLIEELERLFAMDIKIQNRAAPAPLTEVEEEAGCGKPDCGKKDDAEGGGCTSCSTGGGCSTGCGSKGVDLRDYFSHLRTKMEADNRVPLL